MIDLFSSVDEQPAPPQQQYIQNIHDSWNAYGGHNPQSQPHSTFTANSQQMYASSTGHPTSDLFELGNAFNNQNNPYGNSSTQFSQNTTLVAQSSTTNHAAGFPVSD